MEATNEELQSANEELQSTNEELETSKEELQSVNEELMTVNAESQNKIDQLTRANDDMTNLLASTDIATVFLDTGLRSKRFTPAAVRVFKLIQTDIGRPISDIAFILEYDHLVEDASHVLDTLIPQEKQVFDKNGLWYLIRLLPYRTVDNVIDGAVLTFVDITKQKRTEMSLTEAEERCRAILEQTREGIVLIDYENGAIVDTNPEFQRQTGRDAGALEKMKLWDLVSSETTGAAKKMLAEIKRKGEGRSQDLACQRPDGKTVHLDFFNKMITIGEKKYVQSFTREMRGTVRTV